MQAVSFEIQLVRKKKAPGMSRQESFASSMSEMSDTSDTNTVLPVEDENKNLVIVPADRRKSSIGARNILLKGEMRYIREINSLIYLCSPLIQNLEELREMELYMNDLNFHGLSREMVFQGFAHSSR
jgi:guanylate cyclase